MNPIRRELLNGLMVLVVASLLSVAFAAFQVSFNALLWTLILLGVAVAVSGYLVFEFVLSAEKREIEWLNRVGTPARLEVGEQGGGGFYEAIKAIRPGSDYTVMTYAGSGRQAPGFAFSPATRDKTFALILEQCKRGMIREYKRIVCFDSDVLANDQELRSGVLRVSPETIDRALGEHFGLMMQTRGCALFVAPAIIKSTVALFGSDKVAMTVETAGQDASSRTIAGVLWFCDPPNSEIVEQFRQMERETERRMVAVHKIVFPEDAVSTAEVAAR